VGFLLIAVVGSAIGITIVLLRNRRPPNTMEHSIDEFAKGMKALAPDNPPRRRRGAD
jgi:hypothetical protein